MTHHVSTTSIIPCLWFHNEALDAVTYYEQVFEGSRIVRTFGPAETPIGFEFLVRGSRFVALNGRRNTEFNQSISFFAMYADESELRRVWDALTTEGVILVPLEAYEWSPLYGWVQDRYGVSWQLCFGSLDDVNGANIVPALLFSADSFGCAERATMQYAEIFQRSTIQGIARTDHTTHHQVVQHAQVSLDGNTLMLMDDSMYGDCQFSNAISLLVEVPAQSDVDGLWISLTHKGQELPCGWLRDSFGVAWQVVPQLLSAMIAMPDSDISQTSFSAMLSMTKLSLPTVIAAINSIDLRQPVTVEAMAQATMEDVWKAWITPEHIMQWNAATPDWHCPSATNDVRVGGHLRYTMAARDGSHAFDFAGWFTSVKPLREISYILADGRRVTVMFTETSNGVRITETFEADQSHDVEPQRHGWQCILNSFANYVTDGSARPF